MDFVAFENAYHKLFTLNPNRCVFLGVQDRLGDLPDPSAEAKQEEAEQARRLLSECRQIDRNGLEFDQVLDLDLASLSLKKLIFDGELSFNNEPDYAQRPTAGDDITDGIFFLFINDPRSPHERLDNITDRLQKVPRYLESLERRLKTPVSRWVEIDLEKVSGIPALLDTLEAWARETGFERLDVFCKAKADAVVSLQAYSDALKRMSATGQFAIGDAATRELVALRGIDISLEGLHDIAKQFLHENSTIVQALATRLMKKYALSNSSPRTVQASLNERFRVSMPTGKLTDILERYQQERERILAYIEEHKLFPVFAEQDMKIMATPGFMAPSIPAGAMFSPPPFRDGVRTSLVYLTLSDELLDEHTELSIPSMMIHEGIPGHHLQLATASRHTSLIRRHQDAMDQAEGWTTMLEDYMLDHGYMGDWTDEARFCGKRDIARIGARVAIDLFFMTGDRKYLDVGLDNDLSSEDPFDAAGELLGAVTGFTPGRVQAELNWYSQERGYPLSYLTGNHLVWALKHDVGAHLTGKSQIEIDRTFHQIFLDAGNMPVAYLRRVFEQQGLLGD